MVETTGGQIYEVRHKGETTYLVNHDEAQNWIW